MTRTPKRVAMLAALMALALIVAACGSSSSNGGGTVKSSAGQKIPQGKQGGEVTVLSAGDVDYMDPGQMYYTFGYMIGYSVNRALYSFKPDNAEKPVADIAAGEILTEENVRSIRPAHGLPPKHLPEILGRRAKTAIARGTPLAWELLV